jgi:hypothetical protein
MSTISVVLLFVWYGLAFISRFVFVSDTYFRVDNDEFGLNLFVDEQIVSLYSFIH